MELFALEAFPLGGKAGVGDSFAVGKRHEEATLLVAGGRQVRDDFVTSGQIGHPVTVDEGDDAVVAAERANYHDGTAIQKITLTCAVVFVVIPPGAMKGEAGRGDANGFGYGLVADSVKAMFVGPFVGVAVIVFQIGLLRPAAEFEPSFGGVLGVIPVAERNIEAGLGVASVPQDAHGCTGVGCDEELLVEDEGNR